MRNPIRNALRLVGGAIDGFATELRLRRSRRRIESLPASIRKDIGWPDAYPADVRDRGPHNWAP